MELTRITYGRSTMAESWIFPGGDPERRYPIDFAFFLLRLPGHTVLVDAGCDDMEGFEMEDFIGPVEALRRSGTHPEEVTDVIITHAHHDHMAGVAHFPAAHVYIQRQEYERGRCYLAEGQPVTVFDDELTPFPGVRILRYSGHSIGSCVVELGSTVLCGDECYNRYNLVNKVPTAKSRNPENSLRFVQTYAEGWNCLLCHNI